MIDIAGYDDFEIIGRGGFATVYRARQISVGRQVAIKVLSDPSPDADLIRRFARESRAVGALSWHPHIAAVVDAGAAPDGRAFIVFELLSGGSLEDRIDQAPMLWQDAVAAMIQVADAVEAAHREDVLHRDIKPANILINRLGTAKLADFGIASMQDGTKTETGMLAATIAHASPELFDGSVSSRASDIYALGSTLHTLVTGRPPFVPTDSESIGKIIRRVTGEDPPRPDPQFVPPDVSDVIALSLAKHPSHRPHSALAFGKALQRVQRNHGVDVTPMPVSDKDPAPAPRTMVATPPPTTPPPSAPLPPAQTSDPAAWPHPQTSNPDALASDPQTSNPAAWLHPQTSDPDALASDPNAHPNAFVSEPAGFDPQVSDQHVAIETRRPYQRTIGVLTAIFVLLAAVIGGALLFQARIGPSPIAVTAGGAVIVDVNALVDTAVDGFPAENAIDRDPATVWGIQANVEAERNIAGTTFVLRFDEEVFVQQVGIANGASAGFGRISHITWGTSVADFTSNAATNVVQVIPDDAGAFTVPFGVRTDQLALAITDVHDVEALMAGVGEILVVVAE